MTKDQVPLPPEAQQAASRGDVIGAVKITREATGISLTEAKAALDAFLRGAPRGAKVQATDPGMIPGDAVAALHRGKLIEAIKKTRVATGMGLKESKEAVEHYLANNPSTRRTFDAAASRGRGGAIAQVLKSLAIFGVVMLLYLWWKGQAG